MKITIEQVEKLQQRANVSYEEAKEALEKCDGDILEALIMLEKEGKTSDKGGGSYSTGGQSSYNEQSSPNNDNTGGQSDYQTNDGHQQGPRMNYNGQQGKSNFGKQVDGLWKSFCKLLHKGNINHFVISKNYEEVVRLPVTVLIILLIVFNAAAFILLIVLLFFGFRYSFSGPDLGRQTINNVMDAASNTAEDIKEDIRENANNVKQGADGQAPNNDPNNEQ